MADLPKVLVLQPPWIFDYYGDQFAENFHLLKAWESPLPTEQFVKTYAASVEAMICGRNTQINADTLRIIPAIRLIVADSVGLDNIDLTECRHRGVAVTNAGEAFSPDVADMAVGLLIDVLRKISAADRFVRAGLWPVEREYPPGSKVGGRRVGIVGLGSIGSRVAKRLVAFGCSISYNQRHIKPDVPYIYYNNVVDLATNSDVLVISCTLTDQTFHMINNQVLSALGKKGVVINIARGAIIDETELVKFLAKGDIAGAGLDVFENEPAAPKELFEMDNVVLSPHRGSSTEESVLGLYKVMTANLEAFFSNKPLNSPVPLVVAGGSGGWISGSTKEVVVAVAGGLVSQAKMGRRAGPRRMWVHDSRLLFSWFSLAVCLFLCLFVLLFFSEC